MRLSQGKKTAALTAALILTACTVTRDRELAMSSSVGDRHAALERERDEEHTAFDQPDQALAYYVDSRAAPGEHELDPRRYDQARAWQAKMRRLDVIATRDAKVGAARWRAAGPNQVGGRTRRLLFTPGAPDVMFAAGVSGGVWKSLDGGQQWQSTGDAMATLAVVALVFDPADPNTLYAGTGEGVYVNRPVTRSRGVRGNGIYVSRDAGASWKALPSTTGRAEFAYVNDLIFDEAGRLFAATPSGVWLSENRGATWHEITTPDMVRDCTDFAYVTPDHRLLVSCGVHQAGGVYATSDRGATWSRVIGEATIGRTRLAVAPSNPRIVYALSAHPSDYALSQFARSDDGGQTWDIRARRGAADLTTSLLLSNPIGQVNDNCTRVVEPYGGQGWYDNAVAVDPVNPDRVWVGGIDLFRSDNGGRNFRLASRWWADDYQSDYVHADQHGIYFHPDYDGAGNQRLYVSNDGGIFETTNANAATGVDVCGGTQPITQIRWQHRVSGYRVTQFYHGAVSTDGSLMLAGAQDNGTHLGTTGELESWRSVLGGDGAYSAIDPRTTQRLYASSQNGNAQRSENGGRTFTNLGDAIRAAETSFIFIAPLALAPSAPDTVWMAGRKIIRSNDRGNTWSAVSTTALTGTGQGSAIGVMPGNANVVFVGFNNGKVLASSNAMAGSPSFRLSLDGPGWISSIAFDPSRPQRVYATNSAFGATHVLRSDDGGQTWSPRTGSVPGYTLPDVPAHILLVDPANSDRLLLGTDIGLFISLDGGERWYADASGLGNVLVEHLEVRDTAQGRLVYAFTYGRGAFYAPLADITRVPVNPGWSGAWADTSKLGQGFQLEANPANGLLSVGWYTYAPDTATPTRTRQLWLVGAGALDGERAEVNLYRVRGGPFVGAATQPIEAAGSLSWSFESCTSARMSYRVTLDGRELTGTQTVSRVSPDVACEKFRAQGDGARSLIPAPPTPRSLSYGHGGSWNDAARPGQGFVFEVLPEQGRVLVSWYTFDFADGAAGDHSPLWLTGDGAIDNDGATLTLYQTVGGGFDSAGAPTTRAVGALRWTATSCASSQVLYDITLEGQTRQGTIELSRVTPAFWCGADTP